MKWLLPGNEFEAFNPLGGGGTFNEVAIARQWSSEGLILSVRGGDV
jgi:hypothetical protein